MEKISIIVQTIDWTEGEVGHFDLIARKGAKITIDWDDGHCQTVTGRGCFQNFQHDYKNRLPIRSFNISITSEEEGAIIQYSHGFIDMNTLCVDVSACLHLKILHASWINQLKIAGCYELKELDCSNGSFEELDLSGCHQLQILNARYTSIRELNLTDCPSLHTLYLSGTGIRKISLKNDAILSKIVVDSDFETRFNISCLTFLKRLLRRNGGKIEK